MSESITINDAELARMFAEDGGPSMGDIPNAVWLGRTEDGRTREDFDDEEDMEDDEDFDDEEEEDFDDEEEEEDL